MNCWVINAALAVVLSSAGAAAQAAESTNEALLACAKETVEASRLRCFDAVVAGLHRTPPVKEAAVAATAATPPLTREEKFGARGDLDPARREALTEITGKITEVGTRAHGEIVVTLDNGQVWAEKSTGSRIKIKPGDTVKIESGALGSFTLIANGRSMKVARVR